MQIQILLPTGPFPFEVQSTEKISDIAARLEEELGSPSGTAVLLIKKDPLDGNKTVADYDIKDQTTVELIIPEICL